jgi:hypothetical protein
MFKFSRRAAVPAAVFALATSASVGAAVAASAAVPHHETTRTAICRSRHTKRQVDHELMVMLRKDIHRRYRPAQREPEWRELTAHPAAAYRMVDKWSHVRVVGVTCGTASLHKKAFTVLSASKFAAFDAKPSSSKAKPSVVKAPGASSGATSTTPASTLVSSNTTLVSSTSTSSGTGSTTSAPSPAGIPGNWNLTWSDEFDGSSLDTTKWSTGWFGSGVTGPVNSYEQECYDPSQVGVSGGNLNLTAIPKAQTIHGTTYPDTSGMVNTMGKFTFTYGVVEARIYLSGSNGQIGNWPAFWADGTGTWPATGELDVMEGLGGSAAYHFHSPSGGPGADVPGNFTGWHTYAADWQPGAVTYYFDGNEVGKITTGITSSPMYLILNYAVSGNNGPIANPSTMQVDYVRVWQ